MVFSSHIFLYYFLPLTLLGYYALRGARQRVRNFWLVLTGYTFYGWAEPRFVGLMFLTTSLDWLLSLVIAHDDWRLWRHLWGGGGGCGESRNDTAPQLELGGARSWTQKWALRGSVVSNLVALGVFKYFDFGREALNGVLALSGFPDVHWDPAWRIVLPLGISFYTFQALSYIVDVYRGEARAMANFVDFSCFVSMLPHLVAGPILKFSFLAEQLRSRELTLDKFARGGAFFLIGLSKKILLANPCGKLADTAFEAGARGVAEAWLGAVGYAFQIYFDFSGYSDMAIGLGLMFGFLFAKNFDSPYRAESVTEFWRRWHISLSSWLREYLYIPLGGNRRGAVRTYFNLIVTMLLGGFWHGASWNFLIWGGLHGGMLALERGMGRESFYQRIPRGLRVGGTFLVVLLGWVFFRAPDMAVALGYLRDMYGLGPVHERAELLSGVMFQPGLLGTVGVSAVVVWGCPQTWEWSREISFWKAVLCLLLGGLACVVLATQEYNPFIYFIF
jgi:alginate O-acetyltransferase complex protein AlgI